MGNVEKHECVNVSLEYPYKYWSRRKILKILVTESVQTFWYSMWSTAYPAHSGHRRSADGFLGRSEVIGARLNFGTLPEYRWNRCNFVRTRNQQIGYKIGGGVAAATIIKKKCSTYFARRFLHSTPRFVARMIRSKFSDMRATQYRSRRRTDTYRGNKRKSCFAYKRCGSERRRRDWVALTGEELERAKFPTLPQRRYAEAVLNWV